MPSFPYRRVLPIAQLAVYLALIWFGCPYRQTWQVQIRRWIAPRTAAVDGGFDPVWMCGSPSLPEQAAFGINAPAAFAATLVLAPFGSLLRYGSSCEFAEHVMTAFCIPLLWFPIGRWLERRSVVPARPSMFRRLSIMARLVIAGLGAILVAALLVVQPGEFLVAPLFMLAWALGGALVLSMRIRRWKVGAPLGDLLRQ